MKIYKVVRSGPCDYDAYDEVVVYAESPKSAKGYCTVFFAEAKTTCTLVGYANGNKKTGVIVASFQAG